MAFGVILVSSSALGAFVGSSVKWPGGRGVIVVNAAQYGAAVNLQCNHSVVNSSVWVAVNATTYSADQVTGYDLPPGLYRMNSTGSSAGMSASLIEIPYK